MAEVFCAGMGMDMGVARVRGVNKKLYLRRSRPRNEITDETGLGQSLQTVAKA